MQCTTSYTLLFSIFSTVTENPIGTIQSQSKEHFGVEISDKITLFFPTSVPPFLFFLPLVFKHGSRGIFVISPKSMSTSLPSIYTLEFVLTLTLLSSLSPPPHTSSYHFSSQVFVLLCNKPFTIIQTSKP